MPKYFIEPEWIKNNKVYPDSELSHHMLHVLRMKAGEQVVLCDGQCTDYECVIENTKNRTLSLAIVETRGCVSEPPVCVTLYQSLPKLDKMEWIIQKCVELGVHSIVPIITERTVVRVKDTDHKIDRFRRIAEAAAGQSMRGIVPEVSQPIGFLESLSTSMNCLRLAAYEKESRTTIAQAVKPHRPASVGLWIGPEGGFSEKEVMAFIANQVVTVTLGPRILRTETASVSALVQILCVLEE